MELNIKKLKHMRFAAINDSTDVSYYMEEDDYVGKLRQPVLVRSVSERDLGLQVSSDLINREQAEMDAAKANRGLGMLKNSFTSRDPVLWKRLYATYVRPHLEFSIQVWNPYMKGDIKTLEQVQRRATRIPHILKKYNLAARCRVLDLTSLKE